MPLNLWPVSCAWCHNTSDVTYGVFGPFRQSARFPTIYLHGVCGARMVRMMCEELEADVTHPLIQPFYCGWAAAEYKR